MTDLSEVSPNEPKAVLTEIFGDKLEFDKPMAPLSTFKTGGPAKYFLNAESIEILALAIQTATKLNLEYFLIGGGSNLLISDEGFDGLLIRNEVKGLELTRKTQINCGAGEKLNDLVEFAADKALTGIEFASGIAGSVGGAVYGNAGAYGGEIKDIISEIMLVSCTGEIKKVTPDYCKFGYRDSFLKESGDTVVSARFDLKVGDKEQIKKKVAEIIAVRSGKHPVEGRTAGSFFKNIPDPKEEFGKLAAGRLLEQIGAKELSVGGAAVYEKHANMIINKNNATSKDIRELADILKKRVHEKFGIILEEEVISLGKF